MDSIFEQPRTTPRPTPVTQNFKAPVVPEASLLFQNPPHETKNTVKVTQTIPPHHQSYNAWKLRSSQQSNPHDSFVLSNKSSEKENNMCQNYANYQYAYLNKNACDTSTNKSLLKKQVRFERPQFSQPQVVMSSPNFQALLRNPREKTESKKSDENDGKNKTRMQYSAPITNVYRLPLQNKNNQQNNDSLAVVSTPENIQHYQMHFNKYSAPAINNGPRFVAPYDNTYANTIPNTELDLSVYDSHKYQSIPKRTISPDVLFDKSMPKSDTIKKIASSDQVVHQEIQNVLPERKILPNYTQQVLPDRLILPTNQPDRTLSKNCQQIITEHRNFVPPITNKVPEIIENTKKTCSCSCECAKKKSEVKETPQKAIPQKESPQKDNPEKDNPVKENSEPKTDPTVKELLNIVKTQNEQLKLLQNQVQVLIKLNDTNRKKEREKVVENISKLKQKTLDHLEMEQKKLAMYKSRPRQRQDYTEKRSQNNHMDEYKQERQPREKNSRNNVILYKDEKVGTSYDEGVCRRITKGNIITKDTKTEKISVGIMTSFQVSVKSPIRNKKVQYHREKQSSMSEDDYDDYSNRVFIDRWGNKNNQTIIDDDTNRSTELSMHRDNDYSLDEIGLGMPVRVEEPPLSPNNTVHVDMQDYDSDSEDETSSVEPGWTFYDNILGKVNNLLENSPSPSRARESRVRESRTKESRSRRNPQIKKPTDCTMDIIKEARMQHGFGTGPIDLSEIDSSEISFAVKQILMKYMPDEDLANIAHNQEGRIETNDSDNGSRNRYNENYRGQNIARGHQRMPHNPGKQNKPSTKQRLPPNGAKILDITTLKKQPKFL